VSEAERRPETSVDTQPVVLGEPTYGRATDQIAGIPLYPGIRRGWLALTAIAALLVLVFLGSVTWLFVRGVGIWGIMIPVAWGFAIINFVWWIGIGHAGTLISAFLLLFRQDWRTSINRFAEAMTLFAVANAGLFPVLHLGRPWKLFYILPYPNTMGLWPQWRSPLTWDVMAVLTYATVSLLFWYTGLLPDLASMRDTARRTWVRRVYGILALGWRGAADHWHNYHRAYLLLAGLATPLVVSVHSIVSFDFAVGIIPGWHSTVFPPYFVAGAIYSGFAMVFTIGLPMRRFYGLQNLITEKHLNNMAKIMLLSGLIVAYGYIVEIFTSFSSEDLFEQYMTLDRAAGHYAAVVWATILCNIVLAQALWFYRVRTSPIVLFFLSLAINAGMWMERFVIVVQSLHRDFVPSSWGDYAPTRWDVLTFVGTLGFFAFLMLLFLRLLPSISISEVRELLWKKGIEGRDHAAGGRP
jgi:Ni/Fe-hydrogenase subunit HybB-like protein